MNKMKVCPKCWSLGQSLETTTCGFLGDVDNINHSRCSCGWEGKASELVEVEPIDRVLRCLNMAYEVDKVAMLRILCHLEVVNREMLEHPTIGVKKPPGADGYVFSCLALLNGCLLAAGLPKVAAKISEPDENNYSELLGFQVYDP